MAYTGKWVAKATVLFSVGMRMHLLLETSGKSVSFGLCVPSVDLTSSSVFLKTNSFGSSLSKSKSTSSIRSRVLSMSQIYETPRQLRTEICHISWTSFTVTTSGKANLNEVKAVRFTSLQRRRKATRNNTNRGLEAVKSKICSRKLHVRIKCYEQI